ncbi:hypothetical protein M0812_01226 [Anaeramoeba flamelloides]|uniref:Uncharacterized protein n=1 Tax=Anaeramoeba flamelloides TaxID=1746091 RepID=A0AAV8A8A8_9EUKA|nr:hypothetical protein M0812_01226 [Anaeramoeba flamelloides]
MNSPIKSTKPKREGNRANKLTYEPSKEEYNDYNSCTKKQKEDLKLLEKTKLNKERFKILYESLPELFVCKENLIILDKRLVNIYCYSVKNGRSNVRRTISNFYSVYLNVTPRSHKGFIFLKKGTKLDEIDKYKELKEFHNEIKKTLLYPRKRRRSAKNKKQKNTTKSNQKLKSKLKNNNKTNDFHRTPKIEEKGAVIKKRRFNTRKMKTKKKGKKKFKKIIRVNRKTKKIPKINSKTETKQLTKHLKNEIMKPDTEVEKIANLYQEEQYIEKKDNSLQVTKNFFLFDEEEINFSQSDSELSTSDYEETDYYDHQFETNVPFPKLKSVFKFDLPDLNLGFNLTNEINPKEFMKFGTFNMDNIHNIESSFLYEDSGCKVDEGMVLNHTYHEDQKLFDRNFNF